MKSTFKGVAALLAFALSSALTAPQALAATGTAPLTIKGIGAAQASAPVFTGMPFPPGALRDPNLLSLYIGGVKQPVQTQVISSYSDGSIRVALLGFRATVSAGQTLTAEVRYGSEARTPLTGLAWSRNLNVLALFSPQFYGESTVFNLRFSPSSESSQLPSVNAYKSQVASKYGSTSNPPANTSPSVRSYYDHVHALVQTLVSTGGPDSVPSRLAEELNVFRENEIIHTGTTEANFRGQFKGSLISTTNTWPMQINVIRRQFVTGLLEDYFYSGDPRSLEVAREIADALLYDVDRRVAANGMAFYSWTERNGAWAIKGLSAMYLATAETKYLTGAKRVGDAVTAHQTAMAVKYPNQGGISGQTGAFVQDRNGIWFDPEESSCAGCGSPFMSAVLTEGLIRLYFASGDIKYRDSVVKAADWLADACSSGGTYWYVCKDSAAGLTPSLYPMFFETLGFAYQVTGNSKYLTQASQLTTGSSWGNHIKEFNQAMMTSGQGIYLLNRASSTVPLTLTASGLGSTPGPSPTPSPTVSPTPRPTPSPTPSPTVSPTPSPTASPSPQPTLTVTLAAVADAHVLGNDPALNVGRIDTFQISSSPAKHVYIKFTVSGMTGRQIVSAKLKLKVGSDGTINGPSVHTTTSAWTETGITYNNRPTSLSAAIVDFGAMNARAEYTVDVTSKITGNGTYTFTLQGKSTDRLLLGAREGTDGAKLVIMSK